MRLACSAYVICATPRSGSTLVCDLLAETGVAGRPNSFYRRQSMPGWAAEWGITVPPDSPDFDRIYLDAALRVGRAGTPMFGIRAMRDHLLEMLRRLDLLFPGLPGDAARIEAALGPTRYVCLSRKDKVAQAVSRLRAEQSGLWHRHADGAVREQVGPANEPRYDFDAIAAYLAEAEADEAAWEEWFSANRIVPLRITYEALTADPVSSIRLILTHLGLDPVHADGVSPRTAKLADDESRAWAARFAARRS